MTRGEPPANRKGVLSLIGTGSRSPCPRPAMATVAGPMSGGSADSVGDRAVFGVVTVSDRASTGVYEDVSGPAILRFFAEAVQSQCAVRARSAEQHALDWSRRNQSKRCIPALRHLPSVLTAVPCKLSGCRAAATVMQRCAGGRPSTGLYRTSSRRLRPPCENWLGPHHQRPVCL